MVAPERDDKHVQAGEPLKEALLRAVFRCKQVQWHGRSGVAKKMLRLEIRIGGVSWAQALFGECGEHIGGQKDELTDVVGEQHLVMRPPHEAERKETIRAVRVRRSKVIRL